MPAVKIRISDEAFTNLKNQAHAFNYIRIKSSSAGLGKYLDTLSTLTFTDTRPDYLKEWKPLGYDIWFVPEYCSYTRERLIILQDFTLLNFSRIAIHYNILRVSIRPNQSSTTRKSTEDHPIIIHFKHKQTPIMLTSAVIEAIGTELLTPQELLPNKKWITLKPRIKSRELSW